MSEKKIVDIYPMTAMQEGMLFHNLNDKDSLAYNEVLSIDIKGVVAAQLLEDSINAIIQKHDVFRTIFKFSNVKDPIQIVLSQRLNKLECIDISTMNEVDQQITIQEIINIETKQKYNLEKDLLMSTKLVKRGEGEYTLVWGFHHIIMDGWCLGIIFTELLEYYSTILSGSSIRIHKSYNYKDFVSWMKVYDREAAIAFWKNELSNYENTTTSNVNTSKMYSNAEESFIIPKKSQEKIEKLAIDNNSTLSMVYETAWGILSHLYENTNDVVFGSIVSGRPHQIPEINQMVGLFINVIPTRITVQKNQTFKDLLLALKKQKNEALDFQYSSIAEIQSNSNLQNNGISSLFVFENYPMSEKLTELNELNNLPFEITGFRSIESTNYNLNCIVVPGEEFKINIKYNDQVYQQEMAVRIGKNYLAILNQMVKNPTIALDQLHLLATEEEELLALGNLESTVSYNESLFLRFKKIAKANPDKIALSDMEAAFSYSEVLNQVEKLASHLEKLVTEYERIIAVIGKRSYKSILTILAINACGRAYLSLDEKTPEKRLQEILIDSECQLVIQCDEMAFNLADQKNTIQFSELIEKEGEVKEQQGFKEDDTAYVMFTSGSTGKPKGVCISEQNITRLVDGLDVIDYGKFGNVLATSSIAFDASTLEIWGTLLHGGTIHLIEDNELLSPKTLKDVIREKKISTMWMTAALFDEVVSQDVSTLVALKNLIVGGSIVSPTSVAGLQKNSEVNIFNGYGPTENTTFTTIFPLTRKWDERDVIPIGKPMKGSYTLIFNEDLTLTPKGAIGELLIGGDGLSSGYLNNDSLTKQVFLEFHELGKRLYRTGDYASFSENGEIILHGRKDNLVKIRGFRVELEEIEHFMQQVPQVNQAAVITNNEKTTIIAFVTTTTISEAELLAEMKRSLPSYMIPGKVIFLEKFPLTSNGKINKKQLAEEIVETDSKKVTDTSMYTETQNKLLEIYQSVLEQNYFNREDNFFEIGGNSLSAMRLSFRINKEFNSDLSIKDVFSNPTIIAMEKLLNGSLDDTVGKKQNDFIDFVEKQLDTKQERYPVSKAQARLLTILGSTSENIAYNMPSVFKLTGRFDLERLEKAMNTVLERHEIFRTKFVEEDGVYYQKIVPYETVNILANEIDSRAFAKKIEEFVQPFNLLKDRLIRLKLAIVDQQEAYLMIDIHHILSDAQTMTILMEDFSQVYASEQALPEVAHQYKEYSEWQSSLKLEEQKNYWMEKLEGDLPETKIPYDYDSSEVEGFSGEKVQMYLNGQLTEQIAAINRKYGTTKYMVLMSALLVTLGEYSMSEDNILGTASSGRTKEEFNYIAGMFANTFPIRATIDKAQSFATILQKVKQQLFEDFSNQDYQFEEMIADLGIKRVFGRNPLFSILYIDQNTKMGSLDMGSVSIEEQAMDVNTEKFDLTIESFEKDSVIELVVSFNKQLYQPITIKNFLKNFVKILSAVSESPQESLQGLSLYDGLPDRVQTGKSVTYSKGIFEIFSANIEKFGDKKAIISNEIKLSYNEFSQKVLESARYLFTNGVRKGSVVGVLSERKLESITIFLALIRLGAIYMPLSYDFPKDRIRYMLSDSKAAHLIVDEIENYEIKQLKIADVCNNDLSNVALPERKEQLEDPFYLIYTSGSTGQPKGVIGLQKNILRVTKDSAYYQVTEKDNVLQLSTLAFDGSLFDIFSAFMNGAGLVLTNKETISDTQKIKNLIRNEEISVAFMTTALLNMYIDEDVTLFSPINYLIFGGEAASFKHVKRLKEEYPIKTIINAYGPTETGVFASCYIVKQLNEELRRIPIGKPLVNTKIVIVDQNRNVVGAGIPGEIAVLGDAVTGGYLNLKELTDERFGTIHIDKEYPVYYTGDLGKFDEYGNVIYLGRIDNQIKLRGFRIELGEIQETLLSHPAVIDGVVFTESNENGNITSLSACYTSDESNLLDELKFFLLGKMPEYMVPSKIVPVAKIPLTPNGKVDQRCLKELLEDVTLVNESINEVRTPLQEKMLAVWQSVLNREHISLKDNFFELGGDSIKGIQTISKFKTNGINLDIKYLMKYPTIQDLSHYVTKESLEINQESVVGTSLLTPIQKYYFTHFSKTDHHFNQSVFLKATEFIDEKALRKTIESLVVHHDVLKSQFETTTEEDWSVSYVPIYELTYTIESIEIPLQTNQKDFLEESKKIIQEFEAGIDLSSAPLIKVLLLTHGTEQYLLIAIHHLVIDSVSWRILLEDFTDLYNHAKQGTEFTLPMKTTSYHEWAQSIEEYAQSTELYEEVDFWKSVLPTEEIVSKQYLKSNRQIMSISFEQEDSKILLTDVKTAFSSEINEILLSCFSKAYFEVKNEPEMVVTMEGHGRESLFKGVDISRTVGWFTSMYPVKFVANAELDLLQYLEYVKESFERIPNKGMGYNILRYTSDKDGLFNPAEITFNYLGQFDSVQENSLFTIEPNGHDSAIGKNIPLPSKLDVTGKVTHGIFDFTFEYDKNSFTEEEITKLVKIFKAGLLSYIEITKKQGNFSKEDIEQLYSSEQAMLLNEKTDKNLFVFPPHMPKIAYSIVYNDLARRMPSYSFYMFNFLEEKELIKTYVKEVKKIQPKGPYVLMGYSFGGALAYEVTHELVKQGEQVSDIILIDSYVVIEDSFINMTEESVRNQVETSLNNDYMGMLDTDKDLKEKIANSFVNYFNYTKDIVNKADPIAASIHLIRGWGIVESIPDTRDLWKKLTYDGYHEYDGIGEHNEMLTPKYIEHNADIVNNILDKI